ncbi:hypothetical protein ACF3DV_02405 [Chlorogloeopsis fritschii PCC 9212]|jgi:hypothetical protein|uniref:Uncharacterized protein n=1 Tax=Chlorogloeopsis fritschii PCC 6912 TaxID=211165 RepID=A0A3S0ZKW0_CHLFR|nr:hypothetical protein [Chlorogloeopsis fritschii]RUR72505.1 hypothetical protein PCC6912_62430 [Chlorogloeopsis fritschii PCC 6912]
MTRNKELYTQIKSHDDLCLQYIRNHGGSAQLCDIKFSSDIVQRLINRRLVKVTNTGKGFYLQLED